MKDLVHLVVLLVIVINNVVAQQGCPTMQSLTSATDTINVDVSYVGGTPSVNCSWLISPSTGDFITFVSQFNASQWSGVNLTIFDGPTINSRVIRCAYSGASCYSTQSNSVLILVEIKANSNNLQFMDAVTYTAQSTVEPCQGATVISGQSGTISVGGSTGALAPAGLVCSWLITPSNSDYLEFTLTSTSLSRRKTNIVASERNENGTWFFYISGYTTPPAVIKFYTTGPTFIKFTATPDGASVNRFSLSYQNKKRPCQNQTKLYRETGTITVSGEGPRLTCSWLITPLDADYIQFSLTNLSLNPSTGAASSTNGETVYQSVIHTNIFIYDGNNTQSNYDQIPSTFPPEVPSYYYSTQGKSALVVFDTPFKGSNQWTLSYQAKKLTDDSRCTKFSYLAGVQTIRMSDPSKPFCQNIRPEKSPLIFDYIFVRITDFNAVESQLLFLEEKFSRNSVTVSTVKVVQGTSRFQSVPSFITTQPSMFVKWLPNTQNSTLALVLEHQAIIQSCHGQTNLTMETSSGTFSNVNLTTSTQYSAPVSLSCSWLVTFSGGDYVSLDLQSLLLAPGQNLTIFDGPTQTNKVLLFLASPSIPTKYNHTSTGLSLLFWLQTAHEMVANPQWNFTYVVLSQPEAIQVTNSLAIVFGVILVVVVVIAIVAIWWYRKQAVDAMERV